MDILGPSLHPTDGQPTAGQPTAGQPTAGQPTAASPARVCVFCREEIRPGAWVCRHCGSNLAPLQSLADQNAALEERLAAVERDLAVLREAGARAPATEDAAAGDQGTDDQRAGDRGAGDRAVGDRAVGDAAAGVGAMRSQGATAADVVSAVNLTWPHMLDNIVLGLAALLAAHWIATTLPIGNRTMYRIVALAVAAPFGYRFEANARTNTAGQILSALAFASLGTLAIGILDMVAPAERAPPAVVRDAVASFATIALSHYAGSGIAQFRQARSARQAARDAATRQAVAGRADTRQAAGDAVAARAAASAAGGGIALPHLGAGQIKTTAETVKALYDAAAPLVAGGAAVWAAVGHAFF